MQYANLFNWQDPSLSFQGIDDTDPTLPTAVDYSTSGDSNISMTNATTFMIAPSDYSGTDTTVTNKAAKLPMLSITADETDFNSDTHTFRPQYLSLGSAAEEFKEALRNTWRTAAISEEIHSAHVSDACIDIAGTITAVLDTKMLAKRQRTPKLPAGSLTSLQPGKKTRPTSTVTMAGLNRLETAIEHLRRLEERTGEGGTGEDPGPGYGGGMG